MGSSRLRQWISTLAPIYPGEGPAVWLCFGVYFLVYSGIMFGRNSRDALFLIYFGVQYLPYMYFANAVFLVVCSLAYTLMVDRMERGKFLGGISLIFVASLVATRLILFRRPHWFFPVLYMEAQVIWYFTLMQFWTFVGDLFDTRQAKRLFPLLSVGALVGMVGVGLASKELVHTFGTENLLVIWAVLIFAATALASIAYRRYRLEKPAAAGDPASVRPPTRPSEWQKIKDGLSEVGREPLLRSMAAYILLMWTIYLVVDFCFNKTMRARYTNPTDLTTFFGVFIGVQGFLCLVIQMFMTRPVIARLGVGTTINFHPTILTLGTAWMSGQYGFASVLSTKLGDASMFYTFSDSSYQLLYNPISPEKRARIRGFIEGYIRPLSLALSGALVLVGNSYLRPLHVGGREISTGQQLSWGGLVVSIVWLGYALTAKKGYIHALLRNLKGDSPSLRQAAAHALSQMKDAASLSLLAETLQSADPQRVVGAMQFLESFGTETATETIGTLLEHPDAHVRATAVAALARIGGKEFIDKLTPLLGDSDARVRANTVEALAGLKDPALAEKVKPLLQDPSTRARVNTVLAIAAIEGLSAALDGLPMISELARGDSTARAAATFALGRLPFDQSLDLLSALLKDPDVRIRCEAAIALGRVGSPRVLPSLVDSLAGPAEVRRRSRRSIVAIIQRDSEGTLQELARTALASPRPEIRSELADVLGRLKNPQIFDTLIPLLKDPEWRVRWKVLKSFEKQSRSGPLPEKAREALFNYARDELASFRLSQLCSQALLPHPQTDAQRLLAMALEEDRVNIEERVFRMLGILCGRDQMLAIFRKLHSGDARQRADALEALDSLAPKDIGREMLRVLEPGPAWKGPSVMQPGPALRTLATHPKAWIRACTGFYLGSDPQEEAKPLLEILVGDSEPSVRETALYAGWQAFKDAWRPRVEAALASGDAVLRNCASRILEGERGSAVQSVPPA